MVQTATYTTPVCLGLSCQVSWVRKSFSQSPDLGIQAASTLSESACVQRCNVKEKVGRDQNIFSIFNHTWVGWVGGWESLSDFILVSLAVSADSQDNYT